MVIFLPFRKQLENITEVMELQQDRDVQILKDQELDPVLEE